MARMHAHIREPIAPEKVEAILHQRGFTLAAAIAAGALERRIDVLVLARRVGLISKVDATAAREAGLLR
jgi:hypothetical protein